jgi:hypothetical protein
MSSKIEEKPKRKRGSQPGNQNAKGALTTGRKPKPEWSDEILENLGKELVEWANNTKDAFFLQEFTVLKDLDYDIFTNWRDRTVFKHYYNKAKHILGLRQVKMANEKGGIKEGLIHRFLPLYFKDLKQEEREKVEHAAIARTKEESKSLDDIAKALAEGVCRAQKSS